MRNILVVDDHVMNLDIIEHVLKDDNTKVHTTVNGYQALELVKKTKFDLIILDISMPEIDGYELCKILKENETTKEIPIIFITALTEPEEELKALNLGASDFIHKPFVPAIVSYRVDMHINLHNKVEALKNLTLMDGLTEVPNRRAYNERVEMEFNRSKRNGKEVSILMIDIDYFKLYNDTYGHGLGDKCLKKVATTINSIPKRNTDLFARYGGEEFILLLPDTNTHTALEFAQKIKEAVANLKIEHKASKVSDIITLSIGVGSMVPQTNNTYQELEIIADKALYQAKESGRNLICS